MEKVLNLEELLEAFDNEASRNRLMFVDQSLVGL